MPESTLTQNIKTAQNGEDASQPLGRSVSRSQTAAFSTSPVERFRRPSTTSYSHEGTSPLMRRMTTQHGAPPKQLKPFREQDIKILLLENVNVTGIEILKEQGYQVEAIKSSLQEDQLIEKIKYAHPHAPVPHPTTTLTNPSPPETSTSSASAPKPN
jgi:hypothetical protein